MDFIYRPPRADDLPLEPELRDFALYLRQVGLGPLRDLKEPEPEIHQPVKLSTSCVDKINSTLEQQDLMAVWRAAKAMKVKKMGSELFHFLVRNRATKQVQAVLEVMTKSYPYHVWDILLYLCQFAEIFPYFDGEDPDPDLDSTKDSSMYETEDDWSTADEDDEESETVHQVPSLYDLCFRLVKKRLARGYIDIQTAWNASKDVKGLEELKDKVCRYVLRLWGSCVPSMGGINGGWMVGNMIKAGDCSSHLMDLWTSAMKRVDEQIEHRMRVFSDRRFKDWIRSDGYDWYFLEEDASERQRSLVTSYHDRVADSDDDYDDEDGEDVDDEDDVEDEDDDDESDEDNEDIDDE